MPAKKPGGKAKSTPPKAKGTPPKAKSTPPKGKAAAGSPAATTGAARRKDSAPAAAAKKQAVTVEEWVKECAGAYKDLAGWKDKDKPPSAELGAMMALTARILGLKCSKPEELWKEAAAEIAESHDALEKVKPRELQDGLKKEVKKHLKDPDRIKKAQGAFGLAISGWLAALGVEVEKAELDVKDPEAAVEAMCNADAAAELGSLPKDAALEAALNAAMGVLGEASKGLKEDFKWLSSGDGLEKMFQLSAVKLDESKATALQAYLANAGGAPAELQKVTLFGALLGKWLELVGPLCPCGWYVSRKQANQAVIALKGDDWKAISALDEEKAHKLVQATAQATSSVLKELNCREAFSNSKAWFESSADPQYKDDLDNDVKAEGKTFNNHQVGFMEHYASEHVKGDFKAVQDAAGDLKAVPVLCQWLHAIKTEAALIAEGKRKKKLEQFMKAKKYGCKPCPFKKLVEIIETSWAGGKVPLLLDPGNRVGAFFTHSGASVLQMKGMVVKKAMQKMPQEEINEEIRKQVVGALEYGKTLVFELDNSTPKFSEYYAPNCLPEEAIWKPGAMETEEVYMKLLKEDEVARFRGTFRPGKFRTVLTSTFAPDDAIEFMKPELIPLEKLERYQVFMEEP